MCPRLNVPSALAFKLTENKGRRSLSCAASISVGCCVGRTVGKVLSAARWD